MERYVQNGGLATEEAAPQRIMRDDWTIFPHGWPGPEPSFGIVRSVDEKAAYVHDVFFGMTFEFRLDLIEVLTPDRVAGMSPQEAASLERAVRQTKGGAEESLAA